MIPKRIVLDTNVCLDLFVFRDPRWAKLHAALLAGHIEAVTREDCRREWQIVLDYPHLPLDEHARRRCAEEFDAVIRCLPADAAQTGVKLPLCKDPDDQKFLEIARDAQAEILITKDKALLKLARKAVRIGLFSILTPEASMLALALEQT
ncbi:MAG TPA: putative toxin-antitoxin system toxin component, PIN family [Paucimonas sp.]|nr:putative toxin-antitoxin system toxin component, PIN family [Paucimonas sp.]